MLRLYKEYASNYSASGALLDVLAQTHEKWLDICRNTMKNPTATPSQITLKLSSLLILPVQRVPRLLFLLMVLFI